MSSKGFICEVDLSLHLLSSMGYHECPSNCVYLTIELFGKVHKTRPQHAYYPIVFNETIKDEKTFWSPTSLEEALKMLQDSTVVIELRRIDPFVSNGLLLAYCDTNAKDLLFSGYPNIPCSTNGRELYLERSSDFKGSIPRMRYSAFADLKSMGGDIGEDDGETFNSMYNRLDDRCFSPTTSVKDMKYGQSRQSRSSKRSLSHTSNERTASNYYTRQTVSSAIRSRSPSPNLHRTGDDFNEKDYVAIRDSGIDSDKSKEPFVVRKVREKLIMRDPKLHDPSPREPVRMGRSRIQKTSYKNKNEKNLNVRNSSERRVRSVSPSKRIGYDDKLGSYRTSTLASNLESSYDIPHNCPSCYTHSYSPIFDYYANRLARLSHYSSCLYGCHSHCCY